jgi:hypothetical protein
MVSIVEMHIYQMQPNLFRQIEDPVEANGWVM